MNEPDASNSTWAQMCLQLEADFDLAGWGQHARLYAMLSGELTLERRGALAVEGLRTHLANDLFSDDDPRAGDVVHDVVELAAETFAVDAVWGKRAPAGATAVLLVWEATGWLGAPEAAHESAPMQIRYLSLVTRAGEQVTVARPFGQQPVVCEPGWFCGLEAQALRRVIGAECGAAPLTVQEWLGRVALNRATPTLMTLDGSWVPDEHASMPRTMADLLAHAPHSDRDEVAVQLAQRATATSIALTLSMLFPEHADVEDIDALVARSQVRAALARPVVEVDGTPQLSAPGTAKRFTRAMTWGDVLASTSVAAPVPALVVMHRRWCDENLLAWAAWSSYPAQHVTLSALRTAGADRVVDAVALTLSQAGWVELPTH